MKSKYQKIIDFYTFASLNLKKYMLRIVVKNVNGVFCRHGLLGDRSPRRGGGAVVLQGARFEEGCAA